ncbi:type VII secretion integral membrane protein EccD [Pilimelia terevasa]|uniref:type VII secretion integral membrane protein EccD n=1 Tax=Pilimelia terevasa TaxID=53372 RepID=UPI001E3BC3DF
MSAQAVPGRVDAVTADQTGRTATVGLVRLTVRAPHRQLDLALPADVPLAALLPALLRLAGAELADEGERHGGWLLRRTAGEALSPASTLAAQGVRDGALLHLVPAGLRWPAPESDDVAEVIADAARRQGPDWDGTRTRTWCRIAASGLLAVPLLVLAHRGVTPTALPYLLLAAAAALTVGGTVAARAHGDAGPGAVLAGWALPYAFLGAALALGADNAVGPLPLLGWLGAPQLLVGGVAAAVAAVAGLAGAAAGPRSGVAGLTAGVGAGLAGAAGYQGAATSVAAVLLAVAVCGVGLLPLLAIRLGRLPLPPPAGPADGAVADGAPDPAAVGGAVARTAALLTGMLAGHALLCTAAAAVLVAAGGPAARALVAVAGVALLLRARLFAAAGQRVPVLVAGLAALAAAALAVAGAAGTRGLAGLTVVAVLAALGVAVAGGVYAVRPASPYLGRLADLLDTASLVAVVPLACAVLDLYARVRNLAG